MKKSKRTYLKEDGFLKKKNFFNPGSSFTKKIFYMWDGYPVLIIYSTR